MKIGRPLRIFQIFLGCSLGLVFSTNLLQASRLVLRTLDGDFEQEYRIVEQNSLWRVDVLAKRLVIIYDSATGTYTGIEHRDAHYWSFKWADVVREVQGSKHRLRRFSDLDIEGFASYDLTRPHVTGVEIEPWKVQAEDRKGKWKDFESRFWILSQAGRTSLRVQSIHSLFLQDFLGKFVPIHDQIRQAVVRPLWPEGVDETIMTLKKEDQAAVEIRWGKEKDPLYWKIDRFEEKTAEKPEFFQVPKDYRPAVLESLRGILENGKE